MEEKHTDSNDVVIKPICVDVTGGTIELCSNTPVKMDSISKRVIGKIPVVLAALKVQFNVAAYITLPEVALEIKNIKKRLKITQCMLIQESNMLFIKGLVRKNIDYSTIDKQPTTEGVCGEIHHCTVDIPFECTTPVEFNGLPPAEIITTTSQEFEYFKKTNLPNSFAEKDELLSSDLSEFNQISTEYYNELPYCELMDSKIVEFDEYLDQKIVRGGPFEEKVFEKIEEKMVISLVIRILQNREVEIRGKHRGRCFKKSEENQEGKCQDICEERCEKD